MAEERWSLDQILDLFQEPLFDLLYRAQTVHRQNFDPNQVQVSTLLSIKTGGCPEDCAYCPQSAHHDTGLEAGPLLDLEQVVQAAKTAKAQGASRFCMGAAWRRPSDRHIDRIAEMVRAVKALGLETCLTVGMLSDRQVEKLKKAGLDYYNHNLDTSPEYYPKIISTRTYRDRLETIERIRRAGIKLCCGGILGMGEDRKDRARLLQQLANFPKPPESVPINMLVRVEGTPLAHQPPLDPFEFVRTIAVARILMPTSRIRLAAGREQMGDELQALCFFAGANALFYGEKLLTCPNAPVDRDRRLFERLGLKPI